MLKHLKTLPLTILLTFLIWMYAEAQFPKNQSASQTVTNIPIWTTYPPEVPHSYQVEYRPARILHITVVGSPDAIKQFHLSTIHAELELRPEDQPSPNFSTRRVRYTLPEGLTIQDAPTEIEFRLQPKQNP